MGILKDFNEAPQKSTGRTVLGWAVLAGLVWIGFEVGSHIVESTRNSAMATLGTAG